MKKLTCAVMGALMITSVLAGCGKKENTTTAGNEGNSQVSQTQESSSKSEDHTVFCKFVHIYQSPRAYICLVL